jgi:hypothetical protein
MTSPARRQLNVNVELSYFENQFRLVEASNVETGNTVELSPVELS